MSCNTCLKKFIDKEIIKCTQCNLCFDFNCAGFTPLNFRKLSQGRRKFWRCPSCKEQDKHSMASMNIEEVLKKFSEPICKKIDEIKIDINNIHRSVSALTTRIDTLSNDLTDVITTTKDCENNISNLKAEKFDLKFEVAILQQNSRRENIIIRGVPETKAESTEEIIRRISEVIQIDTGGKGISGAHRLAKKDSRSRCRPIVVKFTESSLKDDWVAAFKKSAALDDTGPGLSFQRIDPAFPDSRILVSEHLAPRFLQVLSYIREIASNKGYQFVWAQKGAILVKKDPAGKVLKINSPKDLERL